MNELIGRQIDEYRIDALLGEGGMGAVYRALDLKLARLVALKVMHSQLAKDAEFQKRFIQEARAAARLSEHPSIVPIHYFGEKQGLLYMVMAFISGGSLSTHIQRLQNTGEVVQLKEILALIAQVADALGYAHRKGVIHRDIKPSNVLIQRLEIPDRENDPPMRAIVTDFGLAKLLEGGVDTQTGELMGTYGFMSPEQCLQKSIDGRSDIYSLGVMLYQLTTGQMPFDIKSPVDAVMKHLNEEPTSPRHLWPSLPESVESIILKAIAKAPEDRYQKAEEMVLELRESARSLTDTDVTQFSGERTIFSLVTHLQAVAADLEPSRMGYDLTPLASGDQLVIAQKDQTPRSSPLNKDVITIGRAGSSDVILDHQDVSRQHARIERTSSGWQVIDLKSKNGSFLNSAPLLPGVPEAFSAEKTLRIGPYFIHLRSKNTPTGAPHSPNLIPESFRPSQLTGTHLKSRTGQIGVTLRSPLVEIFPGNRADVQVDLFNQGILVDQFKMRVTGLPATWVHLPQSVTELMPGSTGSIIFNIQPPAESSAKAGTYSYQLIVESTAAPGESVTLTGQVLIKSFEGFSAEMHPTIIPHSGNSRVTIRNEGNSEASFSLVGRDPSDEVQFIGEQGRIRVPAGGVVNKQLTVKAKNRHLFGKKRSLPFEVHAKSFSATKSGSGASRVLRGQLEVKPYIPGWIIAATIVLLAGCLTVGGLGIGLLSQNKSRASKTEVAQKTDIAGMVIVIAKTQTQESIQTQAEFMAATQKAVVESTALALTAAAQGDNDGDGLSNQQELEIGTDPNNPDTDQDGLSDGQEVNNYSTNPKNKDTDGDNLTDGDEVNLYHTSPINTDTDGDGMLDGVEVQSGTDPLLPPTLTPVPTLTPAPSETPEPTLTDTPTFTPTPTPTSSPTITLSPTAPPPPFTEDCSSFNTDAVQLHEDGGNWWIVEGNSAMLYFGSSESEARESLSIIQFYRMNDQCYVGRPDPSLEYWLVDNNSPVGPFTGEDCIGFNPSTIEVVTINGRWKIVDGNSILLDFADIESEARKSFEILQYYGFNHICYVGRPGASMIYFRR